MRVPRGLFAALAAACLFAGAAALPPRAAPPSRRTSRPPARRFLAPRGYSDTNATAELINVLTGPGSGYDASTRPGFGGPRDEITVRLDINNLYAVDPFTSTFTMDLSMKLWWTDPRLVAPPGEFPPSNGSEYRFLGSMELGNGIGPSHTVWTPDIYFVNEVTVELLDDIIKVQPETGAVFWARHMLADLTDLFDLASFPFDRQNLTMDIGSYSYNDRQIGLVWGDPPVYPEIQASEFTQVSWDYVGYSVAELYYEPFMGQPLHEMLTFTLTVQRKTAAYYIKSFMPMCILVALTTVSYWFSVDAVPERLGLSITLVLTIVSFYSSVTQGLPMVSYATTMDWYVFMAFIVSFFSLFEIAIIHHLVKRENNHILATELDFFCRRFILPFWILFNVGILVQLPPGSFPWLWVLCGVLMFILLVGNLWLFFYYVWKRYALRLELERTVYGRAKLEDYGEMLAGNADIGAPGSLKRRAHDLVVRTTDRAFTALHIPVPGEKELKKVRVDVDGDGKPDDVVVEVAAGRSERDRIDRRSMELDLAKAREAAAEAARAGIEPPETWSGLGIPGKVVSVNGNPVEPDSTLARRLSKVSVRSDRSGNLILEGTGLGGRPDDAASTAGSVRSA
ncbi:neurotransmitter-gated ion-channel ligand-binding domain-containing protein [Hyaloraphidium curvatum]|nr:neurotransmitter-gated ion-channel ligand-binding domain-containing protein [Hyaloraphidium curvatum]